MTKPVVTHRAKALHQVCRLSFPDCIALQGVREALVWGQEGVADQVHIAGLTLRESLMRMMIATQDQQGGLEGLHEQLTGAGQVEG